MTIERNQKGSTLMIALHGRLDTTTAPDLENVLKESMDMWAMCFFRRSIRIHGSPVM